MQVPSLNNIPSKTPIEVCLENIPNGMFKRKKSKELTLKIELCSFALSDSSQIKKISLWHSFSKNLATLGTDILILEGDNIKATEELDFLGGNTRCLGTENANGLTYFLDSKLKTIPNLTSLLQIIHQTFPSWLSKTSLETITPKLEAFINIPSIRGLKKMQFEAQYLYNRAVKGSSFSDFLLLSSSSSLQFEKCNLAKLECLATHEITALKTQMSSPRDGQNSELTNPCDFMKDHETRLINHIKRVARKRLLWGCNEDDFSKNDPAFKRTVAYMLSKLLNGTFEIGIVQRMASYDL